MSKKTVAQIIATGNDYTIQVKQNQPSLFAEIERAMLETFPLDYYQHQEKGHGRISQWSVSVYNALHSIKTKEWKGLTRFIHVHKSTQVSGKLIHSDRIYISSSKQTDAQYFHQGIRGHWTIENSLHWVKDVVHKEDKNRIRTDNGPVNTAVLSSIAINIHRMKGYHSITEAQVFANPQLNKLFDLFRT